MPLSPSARKMTAREGAEGIAFTSVHEGARAFLCRTAGRALVLADGAAFSAMLPAVRAERTLTLLWEGDALAPFSVSDVGCVLASGGADVLRAARFFAAVRGVPCALFPVHAALDGVFGRTASLTVAGERRTVSLAQGEAVYDRSLLRASLGEGYARLVLSRLALFEARAVGLICRRPFGGDAYERAFALLEPLRGECCADAVVEYNAQMRRLEEGGAPVGEGGVLLAQGMQALRVQRTLSALYCAFLRAGVPRRYRVPDYPARAAAAGVRYARMSIPDAKEYAARALALEHVRGELTAELMHLRAAHGAQLRAVRALHAVPPAPLPFSVPDTLPERAPHGLCAVMRDFGLWENI